MSGRRDARSRSWLQEHMLPQRWRQSMALDKSHEGGGGRGSPAVGPSDSGPMTARRDFSPATSVPEAYRRSTVRLPVVRSDRTASGGRYPRTPCNDRENSIRADENSPGLASQSARDWIRGCGAPATNLVPSPRALPDKLRVRGLGSSRRPSPR